MNDANTNPSFLEFLPVSLFGAVMGFCGLSFAWGWAEKTWGFGSWVKDAAAIMAILIFVLLSVAYLLKWMKYPQLVKAEFNNPVSISFFATIIISILLLPGIIFPYLPQLAIGIWTVGAVGMFLFAWFVLRKWLDHPQEPGNALPVWVLPIVGTLDVPVFGYRVPVPGIQEACLLYFGIGILCTFILLPIIINRLLFQPSLPEAIQPTLLALIGPFALALSGYDSLVGAGSHDMVAAMFYYCDLFLLLLFGSKVLVLTRCCPFRVSWWAVGFPLVAITIASFRYTSHLTDPVSRAEPAILLGLSTVVFLYLLGQSLYRLFTHRFLLPGPAAEKATKLLTPTVK